MNDVTQTTVIDDDEFYSTAQRYIETIKQHTERFNESNGPTANNNDFGNQIAASVYEAVTKSILQVVDTFNIIESELKAVPDLRSKVLKHLASHAEAHEITLENSLFFSVLDNAIMVAATLRSYDAQKHTKVEATTYKLCLVIREYIVKLLTTDSAVEFGEYTRDVAESYHVYLILETGSPETIERVCKIINELGLDESAKPEPGNLTKLFYPICKAHIAK